MAVPPGTVLQGGRPKAYRPIPAAARRDACLAAVAAYERGDYFLAHELLEPAWMGTDDTAERELYQGLIKVAAAFVHGVRGNPRGVAKNLEGARGLLAAARDAGVDGGLDLDDLIAAIDARMTQPSPSAATAPPLLWRTQA
jgi:predicted metal-dependent hydrolase